MRRLMAPVCVGLILGLSLPVSARTWRVPMEAPTIQAGIDSAADWDTVLVAPGGYRGDGNRDIDFWGKAIVVMSEYGPGATIINCEAAGHDHHRGFYFTRGEGPNSVVQGFLIKNGKHDAGGGIRCALASSPTIVNMLIVGCEAPNGGGILCSASSPTIINTTITGNRAYTGGGICCLYHSHPTMTNSIVWGDTAEAGIEIYLDASSSLSVTYTDVRGGWDGVGNIDVDPLFVPGAVADHYLSQFAAGQSLQSPCVNAGDMGSPVIEGTTRTDGVADSWPVDLGAHYVEGVTGVEEGGGEEALPVIERLFQNRPNPFPQATTITYSLGAPGPVTVAVYDIRGALVRTLASGQGAAGRHRVLWDGTDVRGHRVASGVYFCRLSTEGRTEAKRMVLLR